MFAFHSQRSAQRDLNLLGQEMSRLFSGLGGRSAWSGAYVPAANFWHKAGELAMTMELPGIDIDRLDVKIEPNRCV